jgi:hypothetical protein
MADVGWMAIARAVGRKRVKRFEGKVICTCGERMRNLAHSITFLQRQLWWCDVCRVTAIVEPEHIKGRKRMRMGTSQRQRLLARVMRSIVD